jgi:hypothetical protein
LSAHGLRGDRSRANPCAQQRENQGHRDPTAQSFLPPYFNAESSARVMVTGPVIDAIARRCREINAASIGEPSGVPPVVHLIDVDTA